MCYDMSLKEFEHSGVHDLFKVITFISSCLSNMYMYICFFFFYEVHCLGPFKIVQVHFTRPYYLGRAFKQLPFRHLFYKGFWTAVIYPFLN